MAIRLVLGTCVERKNQPSAARVRVQRRAACGASSGTLGSIPRVIVAHPAFADELLHAARDYRTVPILPSKSSQICLIFPLRNHRILIRRPLRWFENKSGNEAGGLLDCAYRDVGKLLLELPTESGINLNSIYSRYRHSPLDAILP